MSKHSKKCVYLCAVHLNECARESGHRGDCYCAENGSIARCLMLRAVQVFRMDNPSENYSQQLENILNGLNEGAPDNERISLLPRGA
jgi:hypothetical protein